jgi:hypothetical protein
MRRSAPCATLPLSFALVACGAGGSGNGALPLGGGGGVNVGGAANVAGGSPVGGAANGGAATNPGGTSNAGGPGATGGNPGAGGAPSTPPTLSHTMDPITVNPGQEIIGTCQSWTLGNDTPLWVSEVASTNAGAFHHSNWIWVPDTMYTGSDGTWTCADRGFDQVAAGAFGGVFFAQSTQAKADTQAFPPGAAFQLPAHARIIGDVHLLNASEQPVTTQIHFDVYTIPDAQVTTPLQPMAFTNLALDIAPQTETHALMNCATPESDFDIYYVLPHFHALGQDLLLDVVGGPMDQTQIFKSVGGIGQSVGQMFDPPIAVKGATGLGITCEYQNPRPSTVKYGEGDQEMCVVLIYTNGKKAGGEAISNISTTDTGGVHQTTGLCVSVGG